MGFYAGMDVGGTYARIKLADENGQVLGVYTDKGGTLSTSPYEVIYQRYQAIISSALAQHALPIEACLGVCLGASGIDTPELAQTYTKMLMDIGFPEPSIRALNDCEMLLELFPNENRIAVIAGTGAITTAKTRQGALRRFSGWNQLLSDEGSACYIAEKALRAIIKYWDGLGDCKLLAAKISQKLSIFDQQALTDFYLENILQKENVAALAVLVDEAAKEGDQTALGILNSGAEGLFEGIATLSSLMEMKNAPLKIIFWGSVLEKNETIRERLTELITKSLPKASIHRPKGNALDLALELALLIGRP